MSLFDDPRQLSLPLPSLPVDAEIPLVPAQMVNEWTYCPRLAYLEWVEEEWADSVETVEEKRAHARVDFLGLIEAVSRASFSWMVSPTPGHNCPGFIEATNRTTRRRVRKHHSGVYCPGLIEASTWTSVSTTDALTLGHSRPGLIEVRMSRRFGAT